MPVGAHLVDVHLARGFIQHFTEDKNGEGLHEGPRRCKIDSKLASGIAECRQISRGCLENIQTMPL